MSGRALLPDSPHSIAAGAERWPVIDGIAYLRTGRDDLVRDVLERLDRGDRDEATALLLAEQDDWWTGPPAVVDNLAAVVRDRGALTFCEAMELLGFGRVGHYLAHRWSDPTYLAGLALLEAHWAEPDRVFELACGTGPYLREMVKRGIPCTGGDVVFAKLWLARHWVVGDEAELVCFDAGSPWPIAERTYGIVFCHDAFYFLEPKAAIAGRLRDLVAADGLLAIAHVHNSDCANFSAGAAVSADALKHLFPNCVFYDDAELTSALVEARTPVAKPPEMLREVEAFSIIVGDSFPARPVVAGLALPQPGAILRKNPLYGDDDRVHWPSERYRDEYAPRATYPEHSQAPRTAIRVPATEPQARSRELVDLPERW